ncbi:hypothetical protein ACWFRJ_43255 [Streptomyces sp. NPDC055239]
MNDLIDRIATWARLLLQPHGAHRRGGGSGTPPGVTRPASIPAAPATPALLTQRSPYGLDPGPLPGEASPLVRPYLTAHEQRRRRRELVLATLGLDAPGPYWIHGMEVA